MSMPKRQKIYHISRYLQLVRHRPESPLSDQPPESPLSDQPPESPLSDQPPESPLSDQPPESPLSDQPLESPLSDQPPDEENFETLDDDVKDGSNSFIVDDLRPIFMSTPMNLSIPDNADNLDEELMEFSSDGEEDATAISSKIPTFDALYSLEKPFSSPLSANDFCCLILYYQRSYRLPDVAMDGICKMFQTILPSPNHCPASFKVVKRVVRNLVNQQFNISVLQSKICGDCLGNFDKSCIEKCKGVGRYRHAEFTVFNIEKQLKLILKNYGPRILENLVNSSATAAAGETVTDLLSGELYRSAYPNPNESSLTLHLILNSDGAKFTKAKSGTFWPLLGIVAELPRVIRTKFQNSLLLALWQGESKPNWERFLAETLRELKFLSTVGFVEAIDGRFYTIYVRILATVFDLPARASIWNVFQWNGRFGCMDCMQQSVTLNKHSLWPYQASVIEKDSAFWNDVYSEIQDGKFIGPRNGVKGPSQLRSLNIDPYCQNPLDFMHQAYEGVFKQILQSLFGSGKGWSLGKGRNMAQLDDALSRLRFPADFSRTIPSLNNLAYFKASELKNLLLYGLIPALKDKLLPRAMVLPEAGDFYHWIIIYNEIARRLNDDCITIATLQEVEQLVSVWQQSLPCFLEQEGQTYNAHATRHLVRFVRFLGPLHNYSTFAFEGFNCMLTRMVTSSHGTMVQVSRRFSQEKFLSDWAKSIGNRSDAIILNALVGKICKNKVNSDERRVGAIKLLLDPVHGEFSAPEKALILDKFPGIDICEINCCPKIKIGPSLIVSQSSEKNHKVCTSLAKFLVDGKGSHMIIWKIVIACGKVYAICRKLKFVRYFIDDLPKPKSKILLSLWDRRLLYGERPYGNFFVVVEPDDCFSLVPFECFLNRCITVCKDPLVITDECMTYEHN